MRDTDSPQTLSVAAGKPLTTDTFNRLHADYQVTVDSFKMLTDLRFKLLTLVPAFTGVAITILAGNAPKTVALGVGLLGMMVIIGILFYDLRNTQFYEAAVHRAQALERAMDRPIYTQGAPAGGLFNERPARSLRWWNAIEIWHDRSLFLVYGASCSGWAFIIADAVLSLLGAPSSLLALLVAGLVGVAIVRELHRLERVRERPQPVPPRAAPGEQTA